jgi:hypothetical protein
MGSYFLNQEWKESETLPTLDDSNTFIHIDIIASLQAMQHTTVYLVHCPESVQLCKRLSKSKRELNAWQMDRNGQCAPPYDTPNISENHVHGAEMGPLFRQQLLDLAPLGRKPDFPIDTERLW